MLHLSRYNYNEVHI